MTSEPTAAPEQVSFPRLSARTQRFTLGQPRSFAVAEDGRRVVFLRSRAGTDPVTCLWTYELAGPRAGERLVVDPRELLGSQAEDLPPEERARRERVREAAGGVVAYATDPAARVAAFALSGRLFAVDLDAVPGTGTVTELPAGGPVVDPRPDPTGRWVAFVREGALAVVDRAGTAPARVLLEPDDPDVTWGLAEFVAAEEMDRSRGYWWSPDGDRLLVARVDNRPVQRWHIADPANPASPPAEVAYPAAGTANADVSLAVVDLDGGVVPVDWDRGAFPYLVTASWRAGRPPTVLLQSRDQRRTRVCTVDPVTGALDVACEDTDPVWLEIVPGVPGWLADGRLVHVDQSGPVVRLVLGEVPVDLGRAQVQAVLHVGDDHVLVSATDEPTERHVYRVGADGVADRVTTAPGVHAAVAAGGVEVLVSASLDADGTVSVVRAGGREVARLTSVAEPPPFRPRVELVAAGEREIRTAVLLPREGHRPDGPLPVLMDPYGGPHAQRVLAARSVFLAPQWFADQGFAVVVADGRGTPARGRDWERAVAGDLATPVLDDQVAAIEEVAKRYGDELDTGRVGILGWSFGGYLAALAVLRRPDVFHAAVAGAPVTDWRLYDTHYTERYLGDPAANPTGYAASSLLDDAARLERPLMIIHGLADDNVVAAHTLRFSSALLAAGRPHTVLPLSGVTHMTPQEVVAENLLLLQVAFLREALRIG